MIRNDFDVNTVGGASVTMHQAPVQAPKLAGRTYNTSWEEKFAAAKPLKVDVPPVKPKKPAPKGKK